jgi:ribosomal protein S7
MFYLRKLTLGGLEYKVPWALFSKRRILNGSIFVLNTAKRKGSSKKNKIALMLFEALYNQGDAILRRNEVYKIGRENRGLVYFIRK